MGVIQILTNNEWFHDIKILYIFSYYISHYCEVFIKIKIIIMFVGKDKSGF